MNYEEQKSTNNELARQDPGKLLSALMTQYGIEVQELVAFMEKLAVVKSEGWGTVTMTVSSGVCTQVEGTLRTILFQNPVRKV